MDELKTLMGKYGNTDQLAQSGVTIGGTRYMYLSSTDKVIRAKKGTSGVHMIKTTQGKKSFCCVKLVGSSSNLYSVPQAVSLT